MRGLFACDLLKKLKVEDGEIYLLINGFVDEIADYLVELVFEKDYVVETASHFSETITALCLFITVGLDYLLVPFGLQGKLRLA